MGEGGRHYGIKRGSEEGGRKWDDNWNLHFTDHQEVGLESGQEVLLTGAHSGHVVIQKATDFICADRLEWRVSGRKG